MTTAGEMIPNEMITTTEALHGRQILRTCGVVWANVTYNGGCADPNRVNTLNAACARRKALRLLCEGAKALGANAVVGLRFDSTGIRDRDVDFCAYGTAVVVNSNV
jgi:uncharacterized protein YbjQ (UPF0145 family)